MIECLNMMENLKFRKRQSRDGFTMLELIVSSLLMIVIMSFVTTLCFRVNLVWKDIAHHRVAAGELSNQLETLTRLSTDEAQSALQSLEASEASQRTLENPTLTGVLSKDELGTRVTIEINWKRRFPGKPIVLAGWLNPETDPSKEASQ
jgi:type II secretory pathway pseudopilin PulG